MSTVVRIALVAAAALLASGCLTVEQQSIEIHLGTERAGSYRAEFRNIQSDAKTPEGQNEDYRQLLELWRGDDFLLEGVARGRYIRTRELKVEKDVVVGRESGLFRLADGGGFPPLRRAADGTLWFSLASDEVYVESNGTWEPDSSAVRWPAGHRDLKLTIKDRDFRPAAGLAARLRREPSRP